MSSSVHMLSFLLQDITRLPSIGQQSKLRLEKLLGGSLIRDLLFHMPTSVIDRRIAPPLNSVRSGEIITQTVMIDKHVKPPKVRHRASIPYRVKCSNDTGCITLMFFHVHGDYVERQLPIGSLRVISGKVEERKGELIMVHPDHMVQETDIDTVLCLETQYPLTAAVSQRQIRKFMRNALQSLPPMEEWLDPQLLKQRKWHSWERSIHAIHAPNTEQDIDKGSPFRERLAYEELLANQLAMLLVRTHMKKQGGVSLKGNGTLRKALLSSLGFDLTESQCQVAKEIAQDMGNSTRMFRLLQGDVGSGKTVVALLAMLQAVESGKQAALMVPTEILVEQHFDWISQQLTPLDIKVGLLKGKMTAKERRSQLQSVSTGEVSIVIGTHALFQEDVEYKDIGLVVIDEQHRFGVDQRMQLVNKGNDVDLLLLSATPIPRTLMLAHFGEMDCSVLTGKPSGRKPIKTVVLPEARMGEVIERIQYAINDQQQIYWVCPLVEESELINAPSVEDRYTMFRKLFGDKVGMVHGQMKADERDQVMRKFRDGVHKILLATTVIEVGVDVPNATIMVVEHAECFGLAQLHQLRGRVGRGDKASCCLLLYEKLTAVAKSRLAIIRKTEDGFVIAEEDLFLRGGGEVLGIKQSGLPNYHFVEFPLHRELLVLAAKEAKWIMNKDPFLRSQRGMLLRTLLQLFDYDKQVHYAQAA